MHALTLQRPHGRQSHACIHGKAMNGRQGHACTHASKASREARTKRSLSPPYENSCSTTARFSVPPTTASHAADGNGANQRASRRTLAERSYRIPVACSRWRISRRQSLVSRTCGSHLRAFKDVCMCKWHGPCVRRVGMRMQSC